MSKNWSKIERKIYEENNYLLNIEKGQRFMSEYYGIITATKIDFHNHEKTKYSVYGFDEEYGLPRSNYDKDLELIGKEIKLDDILFWLTYKKEYSVNIERGNFYLFGYSWDFMKSLNNQEPKLLERLLEL